MIKMLLVVIAVLFIVVPMFLMQKGITKDNVKKRVFAQIATFAGVFTLAFVVSGVSVFAEETTTTTA